MYLDRHRIVTFKIGLEVTDLRNKLHKFKHFKQLLLLSWTRHESFKI
jgi:hypothetical protein